MLRTVTLKELLDAIAALDDTATDNPEGAALIDDVRKRLQERKDAPKRPVVAPDADLFAPLSGALEAELVQQTRDRVLAATGQDVTAYGPQRRMLCASRTIAVLFPGASFDLRVWPTDLPDKVLVVLSGPEAKAALRPREDA